MKPADGAHILVLTTFPDVAGATAFARMLVESRLAACVNLLDACTSVYRWQGKVETAREVQLLIKTRAALFADLQDAIRARHPYDVPEILAVPIAAGLPAYLEWISAQTASPE